MKSSAKVMARFLSIITIIGLYFKFTDCNNGAIDQGYIFTAPWVFDSDSTETVCLTLKGVVNARGTIQVRLSNTNGIIAQTTRTIRGCSECFDLRVPRTSENEAFVHIEGRFDNGYVFNDRRSIRIRHTPDLILIQSDKHIYKFGDKVQFRVLHVTTAFKPSPKQIRSIWIENPLNVRVYERQSPVATKGIISSSLQLSNEPETGNWTIFVEDEAANRINKTFKVVQYELPKFAIRFYIQPEIRPNFNSFTWKVCANYTYGEGVIGQISANVTRASNQLPNLQNQNQPPMFIRQVQFDGCLSMTINRHDLSFGRNEWAQHNLLNFYVEVTEHGTGIMQTNFLQKEVKVNPFNVYILSKRYFKLGLPYYFKLLVKDSNDEPVKRKSFFLQVSTASMQNVERHMLEFNLATNDDGLVRFDIPACRENIKTLILKMTTPVDDPDQTYDYFGFRHSSTKPVMMENSVTERLRKWKSPSDSYIKIEGPAQWQALRCNEESTFTVHCTGVNDEAVRSHDLTIFYQIMTKNNILSQGSLSLSIVGQMRDETRSFRFDVPLRIEPSMSPKAEILVYYIKDDGEVVSDSETFIVEECFANPVGMRFDPLRSLPGGDVRVQLTASPNSLCSVFMTDKSTILMSGREFNPHKIFRMINDRPPNVPGPSADGRCTQVDPQLGAYERDKSVLGSQAAFDAIGMMTITNLFLELNPCQPVSRFGRPRGRIQFSGFDDEVDMFDPNQLPPVDDEIWVERGVDLRSSFPETWLWELVEIGVSGQTIQTYPIPHTITKWTGNTFCVSPETGLGASPRTSIISFQQVFIKLDLPSSARKTETVPVTVTVYNYITGCFPVTITLTSNQDFNLMSSSSTERICVCGRKSNSLKYHIQPMKVGNVNISVTVSAMSTQRSAVCGNKAIARRVHAQDDIFKAIDVSPAGTPTETMQSYWICGNGGSTSSNYPVRMPSGGISGTAKAVIKVSGDLVAPTANGLEHLVRLPTRCGYQNMIYFAPLVFVTSYLSSTNQLTTALRNTAISHLQSGYQNQLKWVHASGSFSTWTGPRHEFNLWLTAYVIKSFVKARSLIYIDPNVISRGHNWIVSHQLDNGCFTHQGSNGVGTALAVTIAVTIALLESGLDHTGLVIDRAFQCIDRASNPSNLELAMKAYATALARRTDAAQRLLNTLGSRSVKSGDMEHWTASGGSTHAKNIETTSYVLLAIATLRAGHASMGMGALRWLISQRTSVGGFSSTEDTVVAIQAIETFAGQLSQLSTNMEATFTGDNMRPIVINVNQGNRLVEQTRPIPMSGTLHVTTTGQGCALLEILIRYEIPAEHTSTAFYLDVTVLPYNQPTPRPKQTIRICTRYQGVMDQTNMVLIEVEMATGYQADDAPLQDMQNSDINLGKFENRPNRLVLYYNELKKDLMCIDIIVTEIFRAQNVKPAVIKVYDYDIPEASTTKQYTLLYSPSNQLDNNEI